MIHLLLMIERKTNNLKIGEIKVSYVMQYKSCALVDGIRAERVLE